MQLIDTGTQYRLRIWNWHDLQSGYPSYSRPVPKVVVSAICNFDKCPTCGLTMNRVRLIQKLDEFWWECAHCAIWFKPEPEDERTPDA